MIRALAIALLLPLAALGQSISGVSGTVEHGETVTISGSGFTAISASGPLVFETVETGSFDAYWSSSRNLTVDAEARHANSTYAGFLDLIGSGGESANHGYFTGSSSPLSEKWFCQYWFKLGANWNWGTSTYGGGDENLANVKIFRLWNPGSVDENFVLATQGYGSGTILYTTEYVSSAGGGTFSNTSAFTLDQWHLLQFEYAESGVGANDGEIRVWLNGTQVLNDTDIMTRDDYSVFKRPYILGFYDSWNDSGTDSDDFWIDDVVADTTWARVELGDASVYGNCTHREYQPTTSRTATNITVTLNQGSFANAASAYLFVVNADGTASSGYPVEIGGSGGSSTPDIQSATRSGGNAELTWLSGDGGPYMVWLQASGQDVRALATTDTTATLPMSSAATDVTVKDGTSQRKTSIPE